MKKEELTLLLCYNQPLYFSSIEDILIYITKDFYDYGVDTYQLGDIDEYDRVIFKGGKKIVSILKDRLDEYGINTVICDLDEFYNERAEYISFKFPNGDLEAIDAEWRHNYINGIRTVLNNEPIILDVDPSSLSKMSIDIKKRKYRREMTLYIAYKQSLKWVEVKNAIALAAKKFGFYSQYKNFEEFLINKYNRSLVTSTNLKFITKLKNYFDELGVITFVFAEDDEFIPYRMEYINFYYDKQDASYIHTKWKLEFACGWINKEKWTPKIGLLT